MAATRYLKVEPRRPHGELLAEAERLRWLQGRLPVPALRYDGADERQSYMLTSEVPGNDASDERWLADPAHIVALLAEGLQLIHCQPIAGCPFDQRLHTELARAAANVAAGAVDASDFDEERVGRSAASLLDELHATRPSDEELVLIHGDCCFPNVVIDGWALSGFIDLGRCGVADRYHDLAQAERSVRRNLGERWVAPFFAAYGIGVRRAVLRRLRHRRARGGEAALLPAARRTFLISGVAPVGHSGSKRKPTGRRREWR